MVDARDVALAERLCDAAGAAIRPHFRNLSGLDLKDDLTPVTVADRAAEMAMREILAEVAPKDGILGEEFDPVAGSGERVWVLDPIDGTKAFTAGKPTFTTLVALLVGGVPVLGVIDQPCLQERWIGHGGRAWLNGRPLRSRQEVDLAQAIVSCTAPEMFADDETRAAFGRVVGDAAYVSWGGDAYGFGLLAAGTVDVVVEMGLKTVDFGPLAPIVEGAGGIVTDWAGRPLGLASDGRVCAAANRALHDAVLQRISG